MDKRLSFWGKIKAYRLKNNTIIMLVLIIILVLSLIVYLQPDLRKNDIIANISLALLTSLLATIFTMFAEIYVKFKTLENDHFLEDIHTFGIANLNKNKETLLKDLLCDCEKIIWISGYRLIMTEHLKSEIAAAVKRGAIVTAVLCPPWSEGFKLVYGDLEKVMNNYFTILNFIFENSKDPQVHNIFFIEKPLFSDTYRIDQNIVTGPYMHNLDPQYNRLMANDFFSYNLVRRSRLYDIVENEYKTLCNEAKLKLEWQSFANSYKALIDGDYRESEKRQLLRNACISTEEKINL